MSMVSAIRSLQKRLHLNLHLRVTYCGVGLPSIPVRNVMVMIAGEIVHNNHLLKIAQICLFTT